MKQYYVLFPNHMNGVKLHAILNRENFKVIIAPTPRELSTCCGISLLVREEDVEEIKIIIGRNHIETLGIASIEKEFDPRRDRFC